MMSSSNGNSGNQIGRAHVKIAAPPGGATSWSMGWGSEAAPEQRSGRRGAGAFPPQAAAPAAAAASPYTAPAAAYDAPPAAYDAPPVAAHDAPAPRLQSRVSSNAYASGANQNAGNVLTDRPTSKVLAPPGGRSSIVLG